GLRPKEIQFKRGHLYDINPVGVVSMLLASSIGITAQLGAFNDTIKAVSPFIAFFMPFITAPLIAWLTKGRYYSVRPESTADSIAVDEAGMATCSIYENRFDQEDMSYCPFYTAPICSLCCALDSRCHDHCRPKHHVKAQTLLFLGYIFPKPVLRVL